MPRDLRDPQKLGEYLLSLKDEKEGFPYLHVCYDKSEGVKTIPDYDHGESLSTFTMRQYRAELEEAAKRGDRHAADTLKGIPNDDPSGD